MRSKTQAKLNPQQWASILKDEQILSAFPRAIEIIQRIYERPKHRAPASEIAWDMGKRGETITLTTDIVHFVKRIQKDYPFELSEREDGSEKYWDVPFFDDGEERDDRLFAWCLRTELIEALELTGMAFGESSPVISSGPNKKITHRTFLYTWNPLVFTTWDIENDKRLIRENGFVDVTWRSSRTDVSVGDHVFIMRLGPVPHKGIIASGLISGAAVSHEREDGSNRLRHTVPIRLFVLRNVDAGDSYIPQSELMALSDMNWSPQPIGTLIPADVAQRVEQIWSKVVSDTFPTSSRSGSVLSGEEGSRKDVVVTKIERDPALRRACIAHYGPVCQVCEFDFGKRYGKVAEGFIHVHHLNQLADSGPTNTDPIKDMSPLCPNCHAVAHLRTPPFTIEELKYLWK